MLRNAARMRPWEYVFRKCLQTRSGQWWDTLTLSKVLWCILPEPRSGRPPREDVPALKRFSDWIVLYLTPYSCAWLCPSQKKKNLRGGKRCKQNIYMLAPLSTRLRFFCTCVRVTCMYTMNLTRVAQYGGVEACPKSTIQVWVTVRDEFWDAPMYCTPRLQEPISNYGKLIKCLISFQI